jgi:malonate transporter and related proteins
VLNFRRYGVEMVGTVLGALTPIVVTLLLGFVAAWRHDFGPTEATVLNRMVLLYAVPIALFVGTVGTPRAELVKDVAFAVATFVAIGGLYGVVFLLFRFVLGFSLSESVLAAMIASAPAAPFMGPAVLGELFGNASAVSVAIASLVINLIVVPGTVLGLELGKASVSLIKRPAARCSGFPEMLLETAKEPVVWAPVPPSCSCCSTSAPLRSSATDFRSWDRRRGALPCSPPASCSPHTKSRSTGLS